MSLVNLKVTVGREKFNRVISNLRRAQSLHILDSVRLNPEAQDAVRYLKSLFPVSKDNKSRRTLSDLKHAHLRAGWRAEADRTTITIAHDQADNERINTVLQSLDTGHKAFRIKFDHNGRFADMRQRVRGKKNFVFFRKGDVFVVPSFAGLHYTEKTRQFVLSKLLGKISKKITSTIAKEFD